MQLPQDVLELLEDARKFAFAHQTTRHGNAVQLEQRIIELVAKYADLASLKSQPAEGEPVARLLTWRGPAHYPVLHSGICARTYTEFSKESSEDPRSYWAEGALLYTHPAKAAPVPEGWQLVPKEATHEMKHAGSVAAEWPFSDRRDKVASVYKAMIAAAPIDDGREG